MHMFILSNFSFNLSTVILSFIGLKYYNRLPALIVYNIARSALPILRHRICFYIKNALYLISCNATICSLYWLIILSLRFCNAPIFKKLQNNPCSNPKDFSVLFSFFRVVLVSVTPFDIFKSFSITVFYYWGKIFWNTEIW